MNTKPICSHYECKNVARYKCDVCKSTPYCSSKCRESHLDIHKFTCIRHDEYNDFNNSKQSINLNGNGSNINNDDEEEDEEIPQNLTILMKGKTIIFRETYLEDMGFKDVEEIGKGGFGVISTITTPLDNKKIVVKEVILDNAVQMKRFIGENAIISDTGRRKINIQLSRQYAYNETIGVPHVELGSILKRNKLSLSKRLDEDALNSGFIFATDVNTNDGTPSLSFPLYGVIFMERLDTDLQKYMLKEEKSFLQTKYNDKLILRNVINEFHSLGYVHLDLVPKNIGVIKTNDARSKYNIIKLIDFGNSTDMTGLKPYTPVDFNLKFQNMQEIFLYYLKYWDLILGDVADYKNAKKLNKEIFKQLSSIAQRYQKFSEAYQKTRTKELKNTAKTILQESDLLCIQVYDLVQ